MDYQPGKIHCMAVECTDGCTQSHNQLATSATTNAKSAEFGSLLMCTLG